MVLRIHRNDTAHQRPSTVIGLLSQDYSIHMLLLIVLILAFVHNILTGLKTCSQEIKVPEDRVSLYVIIYDICT